MSGAHYSKNWDKHKQTLYNKWYYEQRKKKQIENKQKRIKERYNKLENGYYDVGDYLDKYMTDSISISSQYGSSELSKSVTVRDPKTHKLRDATKEEIAEIDRRSEHMGKRINGQSVAYEKTEFELYRNKQRIERLEKDIADLENNHSKTTITEVKKDTEKTNNYISNFIKYGLIGIINEKIRK